MLGDRSWAVGIKLGDLQVEMEEVLVLPTKELELEFIIDLGKRVHPIHLEVIIIDNKAPNGLINREMGKNGKNG